MGMTNITIPFDEEKLSALDFSLSKDRSSAQQKLEQALSTLYEESVPAPLREYLDSKNAPAPKPKRPAKQPPLKTAAPKRTENGGMSENVGIEAQK